MLQGTVNEKSIINRSAKSIIQYRMTSVKKRTMEETVKYNPFVHKEDGGNVSSKIYET